MIKGGKERKREYRSTKGKIEDMKENREERRHKKEKGTYSCDRNEKIREKVKQQKRIMMS